MGLQAVVQKRCTVQDALIWRKRTNTGSGKPAYELNPAEIRVRWDALFVQVITADNRQATSNATIMSPYEMPFGSLIFLGGKEVGSAMLAWKALPTYPALPTPVQGGYEIIKSGHHPDFNGDDLLYLAYV